MVKEYRNNENFMKKRVKECSYNENAMKEVGERIHK